MTDFVNPRSFEGEYVETDDRETREDAVQRLEALEPLRAYVTEPGWTHLDEYLGLAERMATETLLVTGPDRCSSYQARIAVLREIRNLPASLFEQAEQLHSILADAEGDDDE